MQSRRWCFTLNNPESALDTSTWAARGVIGAVWQRERGEQGTEHFQGYIKFEKPKRMPWVKSTLHSDHVHLEPARGNNDQCIDYCIKISTHVEGPWWFPDEATVRSSTQGQRTDLSEMAAAAKEGKSLMEISELDPATYIRNYRGIAAYRQLHNPAAKNRDVLKVICLHGPSGVGKTYWARRTLNKPVFEPEIKKDQVWFNGYNGEDIILLDEYAGQLPIPIFNKICDPYAYMAPCKMAPYVAAEWHHVIILTNLCPTEWYNEHTTDILQRDSVFRRIGYGPYAERETDRIYREIKSREDMIRFAEMIKPQDDSPTGSPTSSPDTSPRLAPAPPSQIIDEEFQPLPFLSTPSFTVIDD